VLFGSGFGALGFGAPGCAGTGACGPSGLDTPPSAGTFRTPSSGEATACRGVWEEFTVEFTMVVS
jgi:hypothetical protein